MTSTTTNTLMVFSLLLPIAALFIPWTSVWMFIGLVALIVLETVLFGGFFIRDRFPNTPLGQWLKIYW